MTWTLTQTSRAALVAATLALALPGAALAQTTAPDGAGGGAAADGAVLGGGGAPMTGTEDAGAAGSSTADMSTTTGSGQNTGSAAQSGGSADMSLTYERVVADLQSGRDYGDQLEGMDADTTVTVMGLSELEQVGGGAVSTAEEGTPPMTGGQTTIDTNGSAAMQSDTTSGASAGGAADAPAGIADGMATGGGTQTSAVTESTPGDVDAALEQAQDNLTTLRETLSENQAVTDALEAADHTTDDVIALHREGQELTVIVDDRDE